MTGLRPDQLLYCSVNQALLLSPQIAETWQCLFWRKSEICFLLLNTPLRERLIQLPLRVLVKRNPAVSSREQVLWSVGSRVLRGLECVLWIGKDPSAEPSFAFV